MSLTIETCPRTVDRMIHGEQAGVRVPATIRAAVSRHIKSVGVIKTAVALRIARETLVRIRDDALVRPGTIVLVRERLKDLKA